MATMNAGRRATPGGRLPVRPGGAVVCGHIARREIRESSGAFIGDDMAIAGMILGYLQLAMSLLLLLLIVLLFGGLAAFLGFAAAQA